jgi:mono/diheme cytochrome c family protein
MGALGPRQQDPELSAPAPIDGRWLREGFEVRGADLFRYTCRACHGAAGKGAPPEILPLVDRIRDTSWQLQAGRGLPGAAGRTDTARAALRHRMSTGGPAMPPFDHLSEGEASILLAYLERLAALPDPEHVDTAMRMPVDRVGEQIVKGTCQICHDARGAYRTAKPQTAIPPLDGLTHSVPVAAFVARARHRGSGDLHGKGPEVTYLREAELQAAYFYLAANPPR